MRLTEFSIRKYGPLSDSGRILLSNFNLFWGENEDGKTLTLEALVRLLVGRIRKLFGARERVAETPDGYVVVETASGETVTLPEMGDITTLTGLSAEIFTNLFVIRNSNLSIGRESDFYGNVTERLTGLRTTQLRKIKERLRELGYFTEGLDTVNTRESAHLKRRIQQAKDLLNACELLLADARASGYDSLEENLVHLQAQQQELEREINDLERARLGKKYEQGMACLSTLRDLLQKLEPLQPFSEEELNEWRQAYLLIEEKEAERKHVQEQYALYEKELAEEEEKLNEYKHQFQVDQKRKNKIDETLRPLLRVFQNFQKEYARASAGKTFIRTSLIVFLLISIGLLGVLFWKANVYLIGGAGISAVITLMLALLYYSRFIKSKGELRELEQQIIQEAGELGLPGKTVPEVQQQIQHFEDTLLMQQERVFTSEGRVAFLASTCKSLQEERITEINQRIQEARQRIHQIRGNYELEGIAAYQEKLNLRKKYEQQLNEALAVLRSSFGVQGESLSEQLANWEQEIAALEEYRNLPTGVAFDEKQLERKREELTRLQEEIETTRRQLRELQEQLFEMERKANEILLTEEAPLCRTLSDLRQLQSKLLSFLEQIEMRQRRVRTALDIFDEIESDEKQKVGNLFGEQSLTARIYENITRGLYTGVFYNPDEGIIQVKRRDGKILSPEMLSGGAYDQLYFAIRLALAERLLPSEKGFFIFDDPFLKSDRERLQRQMEMLMDISQQGWQVLYFSAKDEVRSVLEPYIKNGAVALQNVSGVLFKEGVA